MVKMTHPKNPTIIIVQKVSVDLMKSRGWLIVEEKPETEKPLNQEVIRDGES